MSEAAVVATPVDAPAATVASARERAEAAFASIQNPQASTETPAAKPDATGRLHGQDGKYVEKPQGTDTSPAEVAQPAAVEAPADVVRIQLAEDHPLRHRLGAEVSVPKALEELARFAVNQPIKQREVQEATKLRKEAERQAELRKAEAEAWQSQLVDVFTSDPEFALKYAEIREKWGDAEAKRYLQGRINELSEGVTARTQEAEQRATVQSFHSDVLSQVDTYIPNAPVAEMRQAFAEAWQMYAAAVEGGVVRELKEEEFLEDYFEPRLRKYPGVQQAINNYRSTRLQEQTQNADAENRRIMAELEKTRLAEAAARHATRAPVVPSPVKTGVHSLETAPQPKQTGLTGDEHKRNAFANARARAEAMFANR